VFKVSVNKNTVIQRNYIHNHTGNLAELAFDLKQ